MAALWCADESGVLPLFLLAAAVHECGHLFVIRLSGGTVHALCLTACGAVLRCSLPPSPFSRAAICLAGPAASFALTALANPLGAYRLAGASALLGLFNLLPIPPLDGGMALRHLADGRCTFLLDGIAGVSVLVLLAGGVLLWKSGFGGWLLLVGIMITGSAFRRVRRPRRTAFQRISPDYSPWHTLSLMYSVAVKFALRFTNGAPSRRTLPDSVSLYLSVSIFAGMYRIGKLLSTASYPLTNPDLTAIILKLIHKCHEKEEYFSFARLERVRSVQAPRRGRRRSLWSRTAEFSLSCSV